MRRPRHEITETALVITTTLDDSPTTAEFLGGIYARAGSTLKAREMIAELDRQAKFRFICPYELATIYEALRDHEMALNLFDLAYETKSPCIPRLMVDARLDDIRVVPGRLEPWP